MLRTSQIVGVLILLVVVAGYGAVPVSDDVDGLELVALAENKEQFVGVQIKPNPQKRSAYKVQESPGLHSHFSRSGAVQEASFYVDDNSQIDGKSRLRREADGGAVEESPTADAADQPEPMPMAQAQVQLPDSGPSSYYRSARSKLGSDANVEHATLRRVPRVNFVTQPRSNEELPEHRDLKASQASLDAIYRRPPIPDSYMPQPVVGGYPNRFVPRGRFFDGYNTAYDRYDPMDRHYERTRYDPYYYAPAARYPQYPMYYPGAPMDNGYYGDRRYGYPSEMRSPYESSSGSYPNRRIIYYAHLPEITRQGAYGDVRGGGYGDYYPYMDDYNYRYNRDMNQYGMPPLPQASPPMMYANGGGRAPERIDLGKDTGKKNDESRTMSSSIRIKDTANNRGYESKSGSSASSSSDFTQPHYRME